ncbi:MAG TPA: helix-turn-helix transcriptional regulator [Acidobacteriaceae bacterium]
MLTYCGERDTLHYKARGCGMEIDRELLKGSISLLLLNLLSRGEMYGYEILQAAAVRSANTFEFKEGTLYPALHQLEKKGLVRPEWRTGDNGRERKYYSLTNKGQKAAQEYERQWQQLSGAVNAVLGSK